MSERAGGGGRGAGGRSVGANVGARAQWMRSPLAGTPALTGDFVLARGGDGCVACAAGRHALRCCAVHPADRTRRHGARIVASAGALQPGWLRSGFSRAGYGRASAGLATARNGRASSGRASRAHQAERLAARAVGARTHALAAGRSSAARVGGGGTYAPTAWTSGVRRALREADRCRVCGGRVSRACAARVSRFPSANGAHRRLRRHARVVARHRGGARVPPRHQVREDVRRQVGRLDR